MCNKQLLDWNCGAELLNFSSSPHFLHHFLCRSAFSPYLCQRLKDSGSPLRRAAVIARTSWSGFFYARKSASNYSQKILAVAIP